ncbi:MAG: hydroxyisourate hydrolase [Woeseiaceae bacterium]
MSRLTTHILDTAHGRPAAGVPVRLYRMSAERSLLTATTSNDDGRTDAPLLEGAEFETGSYELEFDIGPYFAAQDAALGTPPFLDTVVIRCSLQAGEHYHVPLLASPWSYSTYRGS